MTENTGGNEPSPTDQPVDGSPDSGSFNVVINDRPRGNRVTVDPVAEVANSTGVLATARTRSGSMVATRPISGEDIVNHMGGQITVDQAVRLGLVEQRVDGTFVDVEGAVPEVDAAAVAAAQEAEADANALHVDPDVGDTLADWTRALEAEGVNPVSLMGDVLSNPEKLPAVLEARAEEQGKDVAAMSVEFQRAGQEIDRALGAFVAEQGVQDVDGFWAFVHSTIGRSQFSSAIISAVFLGDASPIRGFAQRYLQSTNHEVGAQGGQYGAKPSGEFGGVQTTAAAAKRLTIQ
jgi:hypothetical protein